MERSEVIVHRDGTDETWLVLAPSWPSALLTTSLNRGGGVTEYWIAYDIGGDGIPKQYRMVPLDELPGYLTTRTRDEASRSVVVSVKSLRVELEITDALFRDLSAVRNPDDPPTWRNDVERLDILERALVDALDITRSLRAHADD